jgi:glutathione S-transferase
MSIVFYEAPMSSASPVACALRELDVPHERVRLDLAAGDQRKPEFLKLNPNGKVPTLVVDGTPMFEALAIMMWLGERFGMAARLWPAADDPARLEAMSWSTWAYVTFGSVLYRVVLATSVDTLKNTAHAEHAQKDAQKDAQSLLGILDGHLASRPYLLGQSFSLADLIVGSVIAYGTYVGIPVDAHAHVQDWLARCQARPAWRWD